jgi:hypothetical protein
MDPSPEAHEEAKRWPNAQVYKIDGTFGPDEAVPPDRIVGCWKTDSEGNIIGEFIPNPNYRSRTKPQKTWKFWQR